MARTRDLLVEFARCILEDDDLFVMQSGDEFCIDGWVRGLTKEQADQLQRYRQLAIDKKMGEGDGDKAV